jgi:hypothetical protein
VFGGKVVDMNTKSNKSLPFPCVLGCSGGQKSVIRLLLTGWTMAAMDGDNGNTRKRKLNKDEGMTRDSQGRARTSSTTNPTMMGMNNKRVGENDEGE